MRHLTIVAALAAAGLAAAVAEAGGPVMWPLYRAQNYNWHGNYANQAYGQPVALVVPPTAQMQANYGWGVGSSRVSRLDHQFGRHWGGPGANGPYQPTPVWPQDTAQFGVYSVRAPW